jgi:ribosomal protein L15
VKLNPPNVWDFSPDSSNASPTIFTPATGEYTRVSLIAGQCYGGGTVASESVTWDLPGFEGGQMPLIRRMPKRGFNNARFATRYLAVNVGSLNDFENGVRVDEAALRGVGLANGRADGIKVLGDGELKKKLM